MKPHIKNYFKVIKRDPEEYWTCEVCKRTGKGSGFDIHHIEFGNYKRSDEAWNLISLCSQCHLAAHGQGNLKRLTKSKLKQIVSER